MLEAIDGADGAKLLRAAARFEIEAADGDGEFRAETEFIARRIGKDIHTSANVLAGHVEKDVCRLERRRGDGLVARLLEAAAIHAAALGAEAIFLEVAEDNHAALRLYESFGFYLVGMRPGYYRREGAPVAARTLKLDLAPPSGIAINP